MSMIEKIYDGREKIWIETIPNNPTFNSLTEKINDELNYFREILSEEDAIRLTDLDVVKSELAYKEAYTKFDYGFKLGILFIRDMFSE